MSTTPAAAAAPDAPYPSRLYAWYVVVLLTIAYAVAFILVVQAIEFGVLQPLEARIGRWRR